MKPTWMHIENLLKKLIVNMNKNLKSMQGLIAFPHHLQ